MRMQRLRDYSVMAQNIKKCICEFQASGKNICFHWVPAHSGIKGNERANWLAKQEYEERITRSSTNVSAQINNRRFSGRQGSTMAKWLHVPGITIDSLRRNETTKELAWFLTGHGPFNMQLYRQGKSQSMNCDLCRSPDPQSA